MKNTDLGKYLFKYYKRELNSFLNYLRKAKLNASVNNIHELRVAAKKMKAIYNLLGMLFPKEFKSKKHYSYVKIIFKSAGKIREAQVNLANISAYKFPTLITGKYKQFLKESEEIARIDFKKSIENFNTVVLEKTKTGIKKLCEAIKDKNLKKGCLAFIKGEAKKTDLLLSSKKEDPLILHKIRIHLKSLGAIASLYYKINPTPEFKPILSLSGKSGVIIGSWHDKLILFSSLEKFLKKYLKQT